MISDAYPDWRTAHKRSSDWLVIEKTEAAAIVHRFTSQTEAETFAAATADNANVPRSPRSPREFNAQQVAALKAARQAQDRFERAQRALEQASDDRAATFRAALDAGITYGELGAAFGWQRSRVQSVTLGRESDRKR